MKLISLFLFCFLFISCAAQEVNQPVSVTQFENEIKQKDVQVLDVRTAEEFNSGHIENSFQADWTNPQQFKERVGFLDKNKPVYVYCLSGGRSAAAAKWLEENGFNDVKNLKGGITAWKNSDKPLADVANVKQLSMADFKKMITSEKTVLIDFGAAWCPPCKKMEPIIKKIKEESNDQYKVINIDAATQTDLLKELNIEVLPTFLIYKSGKEVWKKEGATSYNDLISNLKNR